MVRYDTILNQPEQVHLYIHLSNYTKEQSFHEHKLDIWWLMTNLLSNKCEWKIVLLNFIKS